MEPSLAMQKAVFAALSGQISVPVYDEADLETPTPYVQIGDDAYSQDDTHEEGGRAWTGIIGVEVWDAITAGRSRIKTILGEIDAQLHGNESLAVVGFTLDWIRYQTSATARADDSPLYRGIITFEVRLQE